MTSGETGIGLRQNTHPDTVLDDVRYSLSLIDSTKYPFTPRQTETYFAVRQGMYGR